MQCTLGKWLDSGSTISCHSPGDNLTVNLCMGCDCMVERTQRFSLSQASLTYCIVSFVCLVQGSFTSLVQLV